METIGFFKEGRVFVNATTDISVEFPSGPLSGGDDLIKKITQKITFRPGSVILMRKPNIKTISKFGQPFIQRPQLRGGRQQCGGQQGQIYPAATQAVKRFLLNKSHHLVPTGVVALPQQA